MASEIRKVGEQCPCRVGGRCHATFHLDVTFRYEDHSTCLADSRPGPVHIIAPSRSSPAIHRPESRHERGGFRPASVVLAQEREACFNAVAATPAIGCGASSGRKNTAPSASPSTNAIARSRLHSSISKEAKTSADAAHG
jgi:hypothetical protein